MRNISDEVKNSIISVFPTDNTIAIIIFFYEKFETFYPFKVSNNMRDKINGGSYIYNGSNYTMFFNVFVY